MYGFDTVTVKLVCSSQEFCCVNNAIKLPVIRLSKIYVYIVALYLVLVRVTKIDITGSVVCFLNPSETCNLFNSHVLACN